MHSKLYIITGPSGVGKSSVAMELLKRRPTLKKVVTCTTRPPRAGEVSGVAYHFIDRETFQRHIEAGEMFEWDEHYGQLYGSRTQDVKTLMHAGNDVLFVVDVAGASTIKRVYSDATLLFLEAESVDRLLERIERRDSGATSGLASRREAIEREMAYAANADHRIVNREGLLNETVAQVEKIVERGS